MNAGFDGNRYRKAEVQFSEIVTILCALVAVSKNFNAELIPNERCKRPKEDE